MDFTSINDPAGIKALLDQLRASQAWQEIGSDVNETSADGCPSHRDSIPDPPVAELESPTVSNHISSLLSRLQSGVGASLPLPDDASNEPVRHVAHQDLPSSIKAHDSRHNANPTIRHSAPKTSLRNLSYIQSLPIVARLAEDPAFIKNLEKMRQDQELLEQRLWKSRMEVMKKQEEKVKVAQAKAAMVGTGLDRREASALESSFLKELQAFDSDHALPAWDALVTKQQTMLEALGVPGMFATILKTDREKQLRIIQVLDGVSGLEDEVEPQSSGQC